MGRHQTRVDTYRTAPETVMAVESASVSCLFITSSDRGRVVEGKTGKIDGPLYTHYVPPLSLSRKPRKNEVLYLP